MLPMDDDDDGLDRAGDADNVFLTALSKWRDIDFAALQTQLDKQSSDIIEAQKDFLVERKELSTKTKMFRKLPDDEKLLQVMSLLKAYQGMIDALTNRSKLAESAFLSTAKHLAEAPDPYPILEATIAELASTEELTRLAEENARLRAQVEKAGDANALRIQLRQQETRSEDLIAQRVREREAEMAAQMDERERNWTDKEHDYQRQIAENREVVKELKIYQESASARLNEHDQKLDEGIAARLAELDIVVADLERSNLRIAEVERRNGELRSEIAALQSGKGTNAEERANKLEMNFRTLELEYDTVAQKIEQLQDTAKTEKESVGKKVKGLEREIARRGEEVNELKGRLRAFDDYDQIKRELEILRHIEFSIAEDDDSDREDAITVNADGTTGSSLETLLVSRNKKLSNDLTILRVAHSDLESRLLDLQRQLDSTQRDLESQRSLNKKIEEDLLHVNTTSNYAPSMAASTRYTFRPTPPTLRGGTTSPTSSIIGVPREDLISAKAGTPDTTILPIITQQRDRFRARNSELEEDLRKQLTLISSLRGEIQALKTDNLGLYEKIRYLQHFSKNSGTGEVSSALEEGTGASGSERPGTGIGMERYRAAYEESMTPFEAFRGKESARVYRSLNPLEKIVYSLTRAVLTNRYSRNAFFVYCVGLHLLVILVLYWLATIEHVGSVGTLGMRSHDD